MNLYNRTLIGLSLLASTAIGGLAFAETGEHLSGFVVVVGNNRCVPKGFVPGPVDPTRCNFGLTDRQGRFLSHSLGGSAKNDGQIEMQLAAQVGRPVCLSGHSDEDDFVIRTVTPGECTK